MTNPVLTFVAKYVGADFMPRAKRLVVGLAQDFWKDGAENPFANIKLPFITTKSSSMKPEESALSSLHAVLVPKEKVSQIWHAVPGEISEKMWGAGFLAPADEDIGGLLIGPLGLNKDMSVLDLSAGLGGRLRQTVERFGVYITGLEPDPQIALRGMELSIKMGKSKHAAIAAYDPNNFSVAKTYDAIIARETFYRVADKNKLFKALFDCTKPKAQIAFTDYIINPEDRNKPAIIAWKNFEKGSAPLGLVEMAEAWAKVGFSLRVHDDQTEFYSKEVKKGLKRFASFIASGVKPDAETKANIMRRMQTWAYRMAAMEQGLKFYRFYGTRQ